MVSLGSMLDSAMGKQRMSTREAAFWSSVFDPHFYSTLFTSHHQTLCHHIWRWLCSSQLLHYLWDVLRCQVVKADVVRPTIGCMAAVTQRRRALELPASVAPGSSGMTRMSPIHKVPLKRRSYNNRDWHEERGQVVFTHTGSLSRFLRGHYADSVLLK